MANQLIPSCLYIVGTPIGNLSDISERAKDVLSGVDFIAAEDTRVSGKLLNLYGIKNSFISYHEHNKQTAGKKITDLLLSGKTGALVTDAGMPAISDPGQELVSLCLQHGIRVIPIPGACAFITALCASGFDSRRFCFEGFLPTDKKQMKEVLDFHAKSSRTVIFYEAPHRLIKTLTVLFEALGDRKVCLARELTKINEEITVTTFSQALSLYQDKEPRGEYVIIVGGAEKNAENVFENMSIKEHVAFYEAQGLSRMDAIKACAKDLGVAKNQVYKEFI